MKRLLVSLSPGHVETPDRGHELKVLVELSLDLCYLNLFKISSVGSRTNKG